MKFLFGLSILIILLFIGIFYYRFCKNTAYEFIQKYIEEKGQIKKEDGNHGENSDYNQPTRA